MKQLEKVRGEKRKEEEGKVRGEGKAKGKGNRNGKEGNDGEVPCITSCGINTKRLNFVIELIFSNCIAQLAVNGQIIK